MDKIISPDRGRAASRTVSRDSFLLEDLNDFGETAETAMNNLIYGSSKAPIDFESFRRSNEDFQVVRNVHSYDSIDRNSGKHSISLQKTQAFSNSPKKFGESLASESTATIGDDYDVNSRKHVINLMPKESRKEDPMKAFSPSFPLLRTFSADTHQSIIYNTDSIDSTATEHQFELGSNVNRRPSTVPKEEYLVNEQLALAADIEMFNNVEEKRASSRLDQQIQQQNNSFLLSSEFDEQRSSTVGGSVSSSSATGVVNQDSRERKNSFNNLYNLEQPQSQSQQPVQTPQQGDSNKQQDFSVPGRPQTSPAAGPPGLNQPRPQDNRQSGYDYSPHSGGGNFRGNFQDPYAAAGGQGSPGQYIGDGRFQQGGMYAQDRFPPADNRQPYPALSPTAAYDNRGMNYGSDMFRQPMNQGNIRGGYPQPAPTMAPPPTIYPTQPPMMTGNRFGPETVMGLPVPNARLGPYVSPLTMAGDRYSPNNFQPRMAPMGGQFQQPMGMSGGNYYGAAPPAAGLGPTAMPGPQFGAAPQFPMGAGAAPFAGGPYVSPFNGMGAQSPYGMPPQPPSPYAAGFGVGASPAVPPPSGGHSKGKYGYGSNRATNTNNLISAGLYDGTGTVYVVQLKCQYRHYVLDSRAPQHLKTGDFVIVDADRGEDLGIIIELLPMMGFIERQRMLHISLDDEQNEVGRILRQASMYEREQLPGKYQDELLVIETTEQLAVNQYHMQMIVVDADYQFDRQKLTIYYDSAIRVDFRDLVRDLFATFKTRIWFKKANNRYFKAKQYAVMGLATGLSPSDMNN